MSEELAIDVRHISKMFGDRKVVDDVSIQVPKGRIYGFLGPNGSGKTTSIRLICGLLTADAGEGNCLGHNVRTESERIRAKTGYMTQKFSYWEDLTIRENLLFVADMYNLDRKKQRVNDAVRQLGLEKRQHQYAGSLSGGWKQRLALAACILHEPQLLLLDEPTAGVDPKARREFWDEIHRLAADGLTVLVSTHYMDEAERCHAIIYIAGGRIMTQGTIEEVIENARLTTWLVKGKDLHKLQTALEHDEAVSSVAPFGGSLHVCGTDEQALMLVAQQYQQNTDYRWQQIEPTMEDAFIYYMTKAQLEKLL